MNRLNLILVVLLVAQLVVATVVLWPRPATSAGEGESLLPELDAARVVALTITGSDGASVSLAKRDGSWVLPEADDYPALPGRVPPVLDKLTEVEAERLVTQTASSHKRLGVAADAFEQLVELDLDNGTRYRLYIGTSPSYSATHVRADGQDEVFLTSKLSIQDLGAQASAWTEQAFFSVPRDRVTAFTLENKNGRFEFEKDDETWTMKDLSGDETLDQPALQTLISRATSVSMLAPLGREEQEAFGLDSPSAMVILHTHGDGEEDKTYTLRIGAQDPDDKSYVLLSSESPYYVRVSEFAVRDLVEKTRIDLLELPTTPTPEVTPQSQ
jgi:hypothetical protein